MGFERLIPAMLGVIGDIRNRVPFRRSLVIAGKADPERKRRDHNKIVRHGILRQRSSHPVTGGVVLSGNHERRRKRKIAAITSQITRPAAVTNRASACALTRWCTSLPQRQRAENIAASASPRPTQKQLCPLRRENDRNPGEQYSVPAPWPCSTKILLSEGTSAVAATQTITKIHRALTKPLSPVITPSAVPAISPTPLFCSGMPTIREPGGDGMYGSSDSAAPAPTRALAPRSRFDDRAAPGGSRRCKWQRP